MKKKKDEGKAHESPWQKGTNVKGIVPPGRRLDPKEKKKTKWSASGVKGVTPPGSLDPDEGPSVEWAKQDEKKREEKVRANKKALEQARREKEQKQQQLRPTGGFVPNAFADVQDPADLKSFLKRINDFLEETKPSSDLSEAFASLITQSRAPFEIVVAFTVLSALVGKSTQLRRRYGGALERGAKTYYNLICRLEKNVQVPRGLVPETVNALFFDLPQAALHIPYAYATHAFVRMLELLREDKGPAADRALLELGDELYSKYIAGRSLGDEALSRMFPFERPEW
jgi:hypothetical protein